MACAHPLQIKNKYFNKNTKYLDSVFTQRYWTVPCGYCLNCRVDKRNFLEDCCNYEYNKFGCGSFVTFTYDDNHIPYVQSPIDFINRQTLSKDDVKKFLDKIRSCIRYYKIDSKVCNPNFKYLCVGEYGDTFQRPHYHFVFFGLDWLACQKIFYQVWKKGIIDSLPIKDGCFRYVLKYLDKQIKGKDKIEKYVKHNVIAPFSHHSINFGTGLFTSQIDYIEKNNYCYKYGQKDKPISNYLKKKLLGRSVQNYDYLRDKAVSYGITPEYKNSYSLSQLNALRSRLALTRERNLYLASLRAGQASDIPISEKSNNSLVIELVNSAVAE